MKLIAPDTASQLTEPERLEAELDLLVDAELPEDRRRTLLRHIARSRDGWQTLAIRFLQRQVEWQAARNLLRVPAAKNARPRAATAPVSHARYAIRWPSMKLAAAIVLTAGLFGLGGIYLGRQATASGGRGGGTVAVRPSPSSTSHTTGIRMFPLPVNLSANSGLPLQVDGNNGGVPVDYPFAGFGGAKAPGRVVIVPDGHNQAVAFPVQEVAAEKVY